MDGEDLVRLFKEFLADRTDDEDDRDSVVVGALSPQEALRWREVMAMVEQRRKIEKQLEIQRSRTEAVRTEFWMGVEERLGVPPSVNISLNGRTFELLMVKEDAERCGLYHGA